jgi:starvation-inducible DNA-binding protein
MIVLALFTFSHMEVQMTQEALANKITDLTPELGARLKQREEIATQLGDILADAFRLSFNLQGLHWNVEGPLFYSLHSLSEKQYSRDEASVDDIAERIRALGLPAPESMMELDRRTPIEDLPTGSDLRKRVERVVSDYEKGAMRLQAVIRLAEECGDIRTADLLTEQLGIYEEFAWMMRATIAA